MEKFPYRSSATSKHQDCQPIKSETSLPENSRNITRSHPRFRSSSSKRIATSSISWEKWCALRNTKSSVGLPSCRRSHLQVDLHHLLQRMTYSFCEKVMTTVSRWRYLFDIGILFPERM